jgi:hypothetical protein
VRALLDDPRCAAGAVRMRDEIRAMPSPVEVAEQLEALR